MSNMVNNHVSGFGRYLIIVARTVGGLTYPETIEEMDRELTKVIEDFDRAVDVEALRLAKQSGTRSFSLPGNSSFSVILCRARDFAYAA
jgi:hypothetical protein